MEDAVSRLAEMRKEVEESARLRREGAATIDTLKSIARSAEKKVVLMEREMEEMNAMKEAQLNEIGEELKQEKHLRENEREELERKVDDLTSALADIEKKRGREAEEWEEEREEMRREMEREKEREAHLLKRSLAETKDELQSAVARLESVQAEYKQRVWKSDMVMKEREREREEERKRGRQIPLYSIEFTSSVVGKEEKTRGK
uniref:Uncharacterized protein n=2 Tax=Palpitomonas bilix TaxID=652834 RepID=A0A7S3GCK4_9EUKA|mmetsp:Transcript_43553/g.113412  ORF Transcript_43553/g.113412 Transcript_43553/m.113412 type:complete len:204 (+) Transcript_43553:94-705(+)